MVSGNDGRRIVSLFDRALVVHLICDWLLQNHWMAVNKSNLRHPAAWIHSSIHFVGLLLVFSPFVALLLALSHLLIDIRQPLIWWRRVFGQTTTGDAALHVSFWSDQVAHITLLALASLAVSV